MTEQSAPALKEIFNVERLHHIATEMTAVYPAFDAKGFLQHAKSGLTELSVMQRMARVSESLHAVIPLDYAQTLKLLYALAPRLNSAFVSLFLPHFVASYGRDDFSAPWLHSNTSPPLAPPNSPFATSCLMTSSARWR